MLIILDLNSIILFRGVIILVNLAFIFRRIGKIEVPAWTVFMASAVVLIFISSNPVDSFQSAVQIIASKADWGVLFFFAGMFITIDAVAKSNIFTDLVKNPINQAVQDFNTFVIFNLAIFLLSQFVSNVPVAIITTQLIPGTRLDTPLFWMTAALTTTFAGGTTVLGAANNIIAIETSKKRNIDIK